MHHHFLHVFGMKVEITAARCDTISVGWKRECEGLNITQETKKHDQTKFPNQGKFELLCRSNSN